MKRTPNIVLLVVLSAAAAIIAVVVASSTTAPSISDAAAAAGSGTVTAETPDTTHAAAVVPGRELPVLSSTDNLWRPWLGSEAPADANVVWVTTVAGATNGIRLDAPVTAAMMTSDTAGCALTWDGTTARLVRIDDSSGSVVGTLDLPLLNGAWISADEQRNCIAAINAAQGMDSSGVVMGSNVVASGVAFPGPFSLQGPDGYMVGGSIATVLSETHDGGSTWDMIATPKELFGAQYGQAWLDNGSVWLPYAQEVYSESSGADFWTAGVLTRLPHGEWTLIRATFTAGPNGFRLATRDGVITIADKDSTSSQEFDTATGEFRAATTP